MNIERIAFAIAAHPDDIEFRMAGTLILLKNVGFEIHYMNLANGSYGTDSYDLKDIIRIRRQEAQNAARSIGAFYHDSLVNDLEIFYDSKILSRLVSTIRDVKPGILLTHFPNDYMEDHSNTSRLVVSAAFCRGMKNFPDIPHRKPVSHDVTVYHALPHGFTTPLRKKVRPELFVNITEVVEDKMKMLAEHKSQSEWLDHSQGMNSILDSALEMDTHVGEMSGHFKYAEGWFRHLHYGFSTSIVDPLTAALKENVFVDEAYEGY